MDYILDKLYHGELHPEAQYRPKLEAHIDLCRRQQASYHAFAERLAKIDPALRKEFLDLMEGYLDTARLDLCEAYMDGYCLGVRMMAEVYSRSGPEPGLGCGAITMK